MRLHYGERHYADRFAGAFALGFFAATFVVVTNAPILCLALSALFLVVISSLVCASLDSFDPFSPMFIVSALLSVFALVAEIFAADSKYPESVLLHALTYLVFFIIFYIVGCSLNIGTALARRLPKLNSILDTARLPTIAVPFLLAGLTAYLYLASLAGFTSITGILENLIVFRFGYSLEGRLYIMVLALFLIEAPFWAWIIRGSLTPLGKVTATVYWLLIGALSVLTGTRGAVLTVVLGLFVVYHCRVRRITLLKAAAVTVIVALPLAIFSRTIEVVRLHHVSVEEILAVGGQVSIGEAVTNILIRLASGFEGFVKILNYPGSFESLHGRSFYDALFLPVPRAWFPDKPLNFDLQMMRIILPEFTYMNYTEEFGMLGELYVNFGFIGIAIGATIFGILIRMAQTYYIANRTNESFVFLYRWIIVTPIGYMQAGIVNSPAHEALFLPTILGLGFLWLLNGSHLFVERERAAVTLGIPAETT